MRCGAGMLAALAGCDGSGARTGAAPDDEPLAAEVGHVYAGGAGFAPPGTGTTPARRSSRPTSRAYSM